MEGPIGRYARASVDYTGIINVAYVLGTCVANTISASGLCPRKQAGHLIAAIRSKVCYHPDKWGPSTSAISTRSPPIRRPLSRAYPKSRTPHRWRGNPINSCSGNWFFFRSGSRKNEVMQPIAEQVNNDDVRNLGAYFASLTPPKASAPDDNPNLSRKGAEAATGRRCASCHGDTFAGTKAVARLAGQREDYLFKALYDYKSNLRVGGGVAAMADVSYSLSDEESPRSRITLRIFSHHLSALHSGLKISCASQIRADQAW